MKSTSPLKFDLMSSVLDGEAGSDELRQYQERLDSDPEAQRLHDFHARFKQMVKESGQVGQVSPDVRERLMKALSQASAPVPTPLKRPEPRRAWVSAAPWLATAASIALVFGLSYRHASSSNPLAEALARDHSEYLGQAGTDRLGQGGTMVNPTLVAMNQFGRAPEMAEFPGLQPYDAKVCNCSLQEGQGQRILHVVYRGGGGPVVSMYGVPEQEALGGMPLNETVDRIQPTMAQADQEALATWKRHGWVFSLVSNMPPDQLQQLAQRGFYGRYAANGNNLTRPGYGPVPSQFNSMPALEQVNSLGPAPVYPAVMQGPPPPVTR